MDLAEPFPEDIEVGRQTVSMEVDASGWVQIRGEKIWLATWAQQIKGAQTHVLQAPSLEIGRELGLHVLYVELPGSEGLCVAQYLVIDPGPATTRSHLSSQELNKQSTILGFLFFPLVAALLGLMLGVVEGLLCRQYLRAFTSGITGMLVGFIGGFMAFIPSGLIYSSLSPAEGEGFNGMGFFLQLTGRSLAWGIAGMAMGLGQAFALRSKNLFIYGLLGGLLGGLIGGLFFDPIDLIILGSNKPSAHISRLVGLSMVGLCVGVMIGVVELLARDSWLRMTQGPLVGKEFLFFKDIMKIGSSPRSDLYLFNDPQVLEHHATLRTIGENAEIESIDRTNLVLVNDRPQARARLSHGDRISIGRTAFIFQKKRG